MRALPACVRPVRGVRGRVAAAAGSADTGSSLSHPSCAQSFIVEFLKTEISALLQAKRMTFFHKNRLIRQRFLLDIFYPPVPYLYRYPTFGLPGSVPQLFSGP